MAQVSDAVARIQKRFLGQGPSRVHTALSGDLLTVTMEGSLTRYERMLQKYGHEDEAIWFRRSVQEVIGREYKAAVEMILFRAVRSFMAANDPANELIVLLFVLAPAEVGSTP